MKNKGYLRKCKRRDVCFYIKDMELYEMSKRMNFQRFVKFKLMEELDYFKATKTTIVAVNGDMSKFETTNVVQQFMQEHNVDVVGVTRVIGNIDSITHTSPRYYLIHYREYNK